ncbi:uncharacterized protein FFNC_15588 [Fusarium fujikuroi]|nr:uncharacterized protein FFNC_15588 [Fusarium fujikuroi]
MVTLFTILRTIANTYPHIFEIILSHLPGYAAAILLTWLDIQDEENIKYWQDKFVRPLRDLPEHVAWIENMVAHNHAAFLIGADIKRLMERLENPRSYWKSLRRFADDKPIRLWLSVRVSRGAHEARKKQLRARGYANTPVLKDGSVYFGPQPGRLTKDKVLTHSNVILPLETLTEFGCRYRGPCWVQSRNPNANNIFIAFARGHALDSTKEDVTPCVSLCPLQAEERDAGDVLTGNHSSPGEQNRCSEMTPGAELIPSGPRAASVGFQLPYMCLNTGKLLKSIAIPEVLDDETFCPDDYAFIIRFRCMDQATSRRICPELQGVPWPRE